ncbi:MAG: penicillin acylase family protein [Opitutaceae bacterium]
MNGRAARFRRVWIALKFAGLAALGILVGAAVAGGWFYWKLRESLPIIDGRGRLPGLSAPAVIARDAEGVPTIRGANYVDVARALGYAHGQDRFFQMDLARRRAAGELSELFGKATLDLDRAARRHPFRQLAEEELRACTPVQRRILAAYADGVNAGLGSLRAEPFEYIVLAAKPRPWRPEDTFLVEDTMTLTLQQSDGRYLRDLADIRNTFGSKALDFFAPLVGPDDAALDGSTAPLAPLPVPGAINVASAGDGTAAMVDTPDTQAGAAGSNAFAVSGAFTRSGAGLVANDMHLDLTVPNIWYRASLEWPGHRVTGVTLPGAPAVIAGSNGHVAWGFTDAYTGTGDLIAVSPVEADYYRGPAGRIMAVDHRVESIDVRGSGTVKATYDWTVWGPVLGLDSMGRWLVYHWEGDMPDAVNFAIVNLVDARTTDEALAIAHRIRIPDENIVVADERGKIGWTIAGALPNRVGHDYDGRLPVAWEYGDRKWDGWLSGAETPTVSGRPYLWSANQRMLGGGALERLGDNGYKLPARARQIRDDLAKLVKAGRKVVPRDLLGIELDDRALFLERWRGLLLSVLTPARAPAGSTRARFRGAVRTWKGRADPDEVGYTLVRKFRVRVAELVMNPLFAACANQDPEFSWTSLNYEEALWTLIQDKPAYLLNPRFKSWNELLLTAVDNVADTLKRKGLAVDQARWGLFNRLRMVHPFSLAFPAFLTGWLDMPATEMPGGANMPRIQRPSFGASERFVVAPGHERDGIFEMPGGQSGHPLSPFFRAGHEAWVKGEPTPFLPGPERHRLELDPPR